MLIGHYRSELAWLRWLRSGDSVFCAGSRAASGGTLSSLRACCISRIGGRLYDHRDSR